VTVPAACAFFWVWSPSMKILPVALHGDVSNYGVTVTVASLRRPSTSLYRQMRFELAALTLTTKNLDSAILHTTAPIHRHSPKPQPFNTPSLVITIIMMSARSLPLSNARLRPPTPVKADFVVIAEAFRLQTICMSHLKRKGQGTTPKCVRKTSSVYVLATSSFSLYLIRKQEQSAILTRTRKCLLDRFEKILPIELLI
jgi:hypothetical protein